MYRRTLGMTVLVLVTAWAAAARADVPDAVYSPNSWLNLAPGSDPSQLSISWATRNSDLTSFNYTPVDDVLSTAPAAMALPVPEVQIVKLDPRHPGAATSVNFDEDPSTRTFYGVTLQSFLTQSGAATPAGWFQNKVTITGLDKSSTYAYRVGYGTTFSGAYTFRTQDPHTFSFIAAGDPQLGASTGGAHEPPAQAGNVLPYDTTSWQGALTTMTKMVPDAAFVISLGDQIDNTSSQSGVDPQYDSYFSPLQLLGIPVATVDGNHDYGLGQYYAYHYNLPNQSAQYGATEYGNDGDYWFRYGNALFMVLNSNTLSAATHDVFLRHAIAANLGATWRIVCFHHSLYSAADHTFDNDILFRRSAYPALFDKHHIDVVLSGHDHSFTRSFQMLGNAPVSQSRMETLPNGGVRVTDPQGTLYMTLDSGSGSKYYDLNSAYVNPTTGAALYPAFVANFWQEYEPSFSRVTIDGNRFSIVTYATNNLAKPIDDYTLVKRDGPF